MIFSYQGLTKELSHVCDRDSDQTLCSFLTKLSVTVFWRQTSVESVNGQNGFNSLKITAI